MSSLPRPCQRVMLACAVLTLASPRSADPQHIQGDSSLVAFLDGARNAARKYASPDHAIRDGYRALSDESAAGTRTWLHTSQLIHRTLDASLPSGLIYANLNRRPSLVALIWALPVTSGVPSLAPIPPEAWRLLGDCESVSSTVTRHRDGTGVLDVMGGCLLIARLWIEADPEESSFSAAGDPSGSGPRRPRALPHPTGLSLRLATASHLAD